MADPTAPRAARPHRWTRIAWRAAWVLLILVSFCVTYMLLVVGGH
jgi:hypothetical protein